MASTAPGLNAGASNQIESYQNTNSHYIQSSNNASAQKVTTTTAASKTLTSNLTYVVQESGSSFGDVKMAGVVRGNATLSQS